MNYEEIARKLVCDNLNGTRLDVLVPAIAAALRDAANRAAWDGYSIGIDVAPEIEKSNWACVDRLKKEMTDTYGPSPKEARDE